ncbi:MAG: hypothetical protein IJ689_06240 [Alphaproteobacteria bacterium]|nr:hypothetical protein [Alphaproteobacteria bacterium]
MLKLNKSDVFEVITDLKEGDVISTSPYNRELFPFIEGGCGIKADISSFDKQFARADNRYDYKLKSPHFGGVDNYRNIKKEAAEAGITPELYLRMSCIQNEISMLNSNTDTIERMGVLREEKNQSGVKLSTLMNKGLGMCSESAILAQVYLQSKGIKSYLCGGTLIQAHGEKVLPPEEHHFLMVEDKGKMVLFDPFNHRECGMPRVYNTGLDHKAFLKMANGNETAMLEFAGLDLAEENLALAYGKKNPSERKINIVDVEKLNEETKAFKTSSPITPDKDKEYA